MIDAEKFEEGLMTEYRHLSSQISEANELIQTLQPKLQKLSDLITTYGLQGKLAELLDGDDPNSQTDTAKSKGQKISDACTDFFMANGNKWTRLSNLYEHLLSCGIVVGGKNPNSTLSAHLGSFDVFQVERARGWKLTDQAFDFLSDIEG